MSSRVCAGWGLPKAEKDSAVLFSGRKAFADLTTSIMNDCAVLEQSQSHLSRRCTVRSSPLRSSPCRCCFQLVHGACRRLAAARGICHRIACFRRAEKALPQSNGGEGRLRGRHSGMHGSDARSARQQCRGEIPFGAGKENPCRRESPRPERAGNGCLCGFRGTCPAARIATTALAGAALLVKGELDVLTFFMFLLVVSRLYDPLEGTLQNLPPSSAPTATSSA